MQIRIVFLVASWAVAPAWAQPASAPAAAPAQYQSIFSDYRAWREPDPKDWRTANREVGALGGHMGHVRGLAQQKPTTAAPADTQARPSPPAPNPEPRK